jgi:predicted RNase H-like nuclease
VNGYRVLGADACRAGWVGILLSPGPPEAWFAPRIQDLAAAAAAGGELAAIAIDIPIGLADTGRRQADMAARRALGRRWAAIFITPVRAALAAPDYPAAALVNRRLAGEGISRQAFALRGKIVEVDRWLRQAPARVVEAHPELSFAELAGAPLRHGKTTWAGAVGRRSLLARAGIELPDDLGPAGEYARIDDILDAAAVAWTAQRVAGGQALHLPGTPETFSDGIECAIWT